METSDKEAHGHTDNISRKIKTKHAQTQSNLQLRLSRYMDVERACGEHPLQAHWCCSAHRLVVNKSARPGGASACFQTTIRSPFSCVENAKVHPRRNKQLSLKRDEHILQATGYSRIVHAILIHEAITLFTRNKNNKERLLEL